MNCGCTNTVGEEKNIPQTAHIRTNLTDAKPPLRTNQDRCISRGARKVKKRPSAVIVSATTALQHSRQAKDM